jgi:hypothetical protein
VTLANAYRGFIPICKKYGGICDDKKIAPRVACDYQSEYSEVIYPILDML